jgi:hypothetical protein
LYTYTIILSYWQGLLLDLLERFPIVKLALEVLADSYIVPTALVMMALVRWFEGRVVTRRAANQRAVLRSLLAALMAWGLAVSAGLALKAGFGGPGWGRVWADWTFWRGIPSPNLAAAVGAALGAASWRQNWRWGLGCFLVAGLWAGAQVCLGFYYPMDVVSGTLLGIILGWLLGSLRWFDRLMGVFVRLARRWMLA